MASIKVSIKDAKTGIEVARSLHPVNCRCKGREEMVAMSEAKNRAMDMAKQSWCKRYGMPVAMFESLLSDGRIDPLKEYVFEVVHVEVKY